MRSETSALLSPIWARLSCTSNAVLAFTYMAVAFNLHFSGFPSNSRMSHRAESNNGYSSWNTVCLLHFLSALVSSQRGEKEKDLKWLWHALFLTNSSCFQFIAFPPSRASCVMGEAEWSSSGFYIQMRIVATLLKIKAKKESHLQQRSLWILNLKTTQQ